MNERADVAYFVEHELRLRQSLLLPAHRCYDLRSVAVLARFIDAITSVFLLARSVFGLLGYGLSVRSANIGKWSEANNDRRLRWNPAWLTFKW